MAENETPIQAPIEPIVENEGVENTPVENTEATNEQITAADKTQLDAVSQLVQSQDLPKGTTYYKDGEGKLQFIIPIDGKKYQVDFAGLVKGFNLNQAGYKRLEESKALNKQYSDFIGRLKQNPDELWDFAEKLGLDPLKLAEGRLQKAVEESQMTDEQKRLREFERNSKKKQEEWERRERELAEKEMAMESQKYQQKYSEDLITALKKNGLKTDTMSFGSVKGIAREAVKKVTNALQKGVELSMEDAVLEAKQELQAYIQDAVTMIGDDHIADFFPSEIAEKLMKASLSKKVVTPTTKTVGQPVSLKETGNTKKKKPPIGDYFRNLK